MIPSFVYVAMMVVSAIFFLGAAAWAAWKDRKPAEPVEDPFAEAWAVATSIFEETDELDGSTASLIL
jgi:hypothetical protein